VSRGGVTRLPTGTPMVTEIQMALVVEFRRHRAKDLPPWRESIHAWSLSCPSSVANRQQEREEP
jgi:hypothetical protein